MLQNVAKNVTKKCSKNVAKNVAKMLQKYCKTFEILANVADSLKMLQM